MSRPSKFLNRLRRSLCGWCAALALGIAFEAAAGPPQVGVFYFPGWKDNTVGLTYPLPWAPIKAYPEREPLLGWYDEGQSSVMEQHLSWMASHQLSFVVFAYYWAERPIMAHAVQAYQRSQGKNRVQYALMWANHDDQRPKTLSEFDGMVDDLIQNHLARPEYLRVNGKPVLMVMVPQFLEGRTKALARSNGDLTARLQTAMRRAGLPEVILLAGAGGGKHEVTQNAKAWGYAGYFAYNYHGGVDGRTQGELRSSRSYRELDDGYREHWNWFISKGDLPYVIPMTSGWDMRPWGGSQDKLHDNSMATPPEFLQHLKAARTLMLANPAKTLSLGVMCCWNEFGEGSYIEPTKAQGMRYLNAVKSVFEP